MKHSAGAHVKSWCKLAARTTGVPSVRLDHNRLMRIRRLTCTTSPCRDMVCGDRRPLPRPRQRSTRYPSLSALDRIQVSHSASSAIDDTHRPSIPGIRVELLQWLPKNICMLEKRVFKALARQGCASK